MKNQILINQLLPTFGPAAGGVGTVVKNISKVSVSDPDISVIIRDLGRGESYESFRNLRRPVSGSLPFAILKTINEIRARTSESPDIIHLHGVWHPLSAVSVVSKFIFGKKLVCSPHGMLTKWIMSRNRVKKRVAWLAYEGLHWKSVHCFHALTQTEASEISAMVDNTKRIAVIENGIPVSEVCPQVNRDSGISPYILYLGRFHEKKGIQLLLDAWKLLQPDVDRAVVLKLVGWGEMDCLKGQLPPNVEVLPPVNDDSKKGELIRNAKFLILPSFSEGLPMVILEAWAQGVPVIMTPDCNLGVGFENGAAIRIETQVSSIATGISDALSMSEDERCDMGERGWRLCRERFSIEAMWNKLRELYLWVLEPKGTIEPSSVKFFQ